MDAGKSHELAGGAGGAALELELELVVVVVSVAPLGSDKQICNRFGDDALKRLVLQSPKL